MPSTAVADQWKCKECKLIVRRNQAANRYGLLECPRCLSRGTVGTLRAWSGGPTESEPNKPYCNPDQSCCDFCCGN